MKTLDQKTIERIKASYYPNFVEAMVGDPIKVDQILSFIERHKNTITLTFEQVFFSPDGFDVYELNGEKRFFNVKNELFDVSPLRDEDAVGDWREWLKKARKIEELR